MENEHIVGLNTHVIDSFSSWNGDLQAQEFGIHIYLYLIHSLKESTPDSSVHNGSL